MNIRTKAGLILEKYLNNLPHRYLFCWNGEENNASTAYDCACCLTWPDDDLYQRCGCICHERIEEMANQRHVHLWLLALAQQDMLPPVFSSYEEKLKYSRDILEQHNAYTVSQHEMSQGRWPVRDCKCEFCEFVRDDVHRQFKLPGEEGYEENVHGNEEREPETA